MYDVCMMYISFCSDSGFAVTVERFPRWSRPSPPVLMPTPNGNCLSHLFPSGAPENVFWTGRICRDKDDGVKAQGYRNHLGNACKPLRIRDPPLNPVSIHQWTECIGILTPLQMWASNYLRQFETKPQMGHLLLGSSTCVALGQNMSKRSWQQKIGNQFQLHSILARDSEVGNLEQLSATGIGISEIRNWNEVFRNNPMMNGSHIFLSYKLHTLCIYALRYTFSFYGPKLAAWKCRQTFSSQVSKSRSALANASMIDSQWATSCYTW